MKTNNLIDKKLQDGNLGTACSSMSSVYLREDIFGTMKVLIDKPILVGSFSPKLSTGIW